MQNEIFENILLGLSVAVSPSGLFYCLVGVVLGTITGIIPGIGALAAVSLLFPITFHLAPTEALIMLAGIYYGQPTADRRHQSFSTCPEPHLQLWHVLMAIPWPSKGAVVWRCS